MHEIYGLSFLYVILPAAVAVLLLVPPAWRSFALLLLSLGYYLLAQPQMLLYMVSCAAMDWAALLVLERFDDTPRVRSFCLAFSACKSGLVILWLEAMLRTGRLGETPLGMQVVALSGFWCVLEVYRRKAPFLESPVALGTYCFFFPRLYAGPMTPYSEFAPQLETPSPTLPELGRGAALFLQGAAKTGILGVELGALYETLRALPEADRSVAGAWCGVLILALSVYYKLSGYTAMARGVAGMMGLTLPRNFYYPYQARGIEDFFNRFNRTVGRFWQDVLPATEKKPLDILRILATGAACGCFFGLRANYLAWGLFLGVFAALERYLYPRLLAGLPTLFRRLYSFFIVLCSFVFFGSGSAAEAARTAGELFGAGGLPLFTADSRLGYIFSSNWLLLVVGIVLATSLLSLPAGVLRAKFPKAAAVLTGAGSILLLVLITGFSLG